MASLSARLTKLQAVNDMLFTIGEAPVNALDGSFSDASTAERVLDETTREVLLDGWHVNTRREVELTPDNDDLIKVGENVLKVDTVRESKDSNVSLRRDSADSSWILYDIDEDRETWPNVSKLIVDQVVLVEFANLTPALQLYISKLAGQRFQDGAMASQVLHEIKQKQVDDALASALQEDVDNSDVNMLADNVHAARIARRRNPAAGS